MKPSLAAAAVREGDTLRCTIGLRAEPRTVPELLVDNARRLGGRTAYREKQGSDHREVTWEELLARVVGLAEFLRGIGIAPGDRVASISRNRGELLVTELAVMAAGAVFVPIFPGYSEGQTRALLSHAGARVAVISGAEHVEKTCGVAELRRLVTFDRLSAGGAGTPPVNFFPEAAAPAAGGVSVLADRLRAGGRGADPRDVCLLMYTSGTSGEHKGVLLTHDNILSQQRALGAVWDLGPEDRLLSYLPWHHSFGGIFEKYAALAHGAALTIDESYGKNLPLLIENWKRVRPTVYFSVPLVHQELVNHVTLNPAEEPRIYHPELKFVFTAAAPLPARISEFLATRRIPVVEGWGLTETAPCCTLTDLHERRTIPGMVGYPIPGVEIRVAEDGEILVQGPNVMVGYHGDPEATARALPGDGWFHTGDLGEIAGNGLKLLARKDRVFKLLNAEKVVPTLIENRLAGMNRYIRHVIVVGSGQSSLAALIFPDYALIDEEFGGDREEAARQVKESLRDTVLELNRTHPVKYETLQAFAVVDRELTVESGDLTPSLKVRVRNVLAAAEDTVHAIYDPLRDCDCRFLSKVMRLDPDPRACPHGSDRTLADCHDCGRFLFDR